MAHVGQKIAQRIVSLIIRHSHAARNLVRHGEDFRHRAGQARLTAVLQTVAVQVQPCPAADRCRVGLVDYHDRERLLDPQARTVRGSHPNVERALHVDIEDRGRQ